jgi:deoxyribonuclease IV
MGNLAIGSHIGGDDPIAQAKVLGLDHVQIFLADPQSWKGSIFPHPEGAQGLKASSEAAGIGIYVHARYIINVATTNNKVRIPSRKLLQTDVDAAAAVGAKAVIVHGGHVTDGDDPQAGVDNWVKALAQLDMKVPVLIENTAGGKNSMARRLESIKRLWDAVGETSVGFCLDTCHAHAGGIEMSNLAETILGVTGRIDLMHCNNSRDLFDSGADRHANLGEGQIELADIIHCLKTAKAPIVLETPFEGVAADLELLRKAL